MSLVNRQHGGGGAGKRGVRTGGGGTEAWEGRESPPGERVGGSPLSQPLAAQAEAVSSNGARSSHLSGL